MFLYFLASLGLCFLIKYGSLFDDYKEYLIHLNPIFFEKLFSCALCLGFWTGLIVGLLVFKDNILNVILFSSASSVICFLVDLFKNKFLDK